VIVLDTNVLSELLRPSPSPAVEQWLSNQSATSVFITTITKSEIVYGLRILPKGKRRDTLEAAMGAIFSEDFGGRTLPFDEAAAERYATIAAHRRQIGRPISQFDAQIAAIAACRGADLATRNAGDFEETGVTIVNPWQAGQPL
jgi:hypothetical protein